MKVSIMSMQRIANYGSFLQAYALKKTIETLGHQVDFADYRVQPCLIQPQKVEQGTISLESIRNSLQYIHFQ